MSTKRDGTTLNSFMLLRRTSAAAVHPCYNETGRKRLKSALKKTKYQRLKKRKVFKIVKDETLWDFGKSNLLQNIKNPGGGPFGKIEKFSVETWKESALGVY